MFTMTGRPYYSARVNVYRPFLSSKAPLGFFSRCLIEETNLATLNVTITMKAPLHVIDLWVSRAELSRFRRQIIVKRSRVFRTGPGSDLCVVIYSAKDPLVAVVVLELDVFEQEYFMLSFRYVRRKANNVNPPSIPLC